VSIQTLEQIVGNGDHHLCHGMSIYGIAEARTGMAQWSPTRAHTGRGN
jgi:hypothetical protein